MPEHNQDQHTPRRRRAQPQTPMPSQLPHQQPSQLSPATAVPVIPPEVDEADGVVDELQAWYLARAERDGWVYTNVLRQLVNRMYRERDYLEQRKRAGRRTAYDYAVDRDQVALAWAIKAIVCHVPTEDKVRPEPPKPPRRPSRRLSAAEKVTYRGRPSWNEQPKRGWDGIELPDQLPQRDTLGDSAASTPKRSTTLDTPAS